jgi:hypothetical protein
VRREFIRGAKTKVGLGQERRKETTDGTVRTKAVQVDRTLCRNAADTDAYDVPPSQIFSMSCSVAF